MTRTLLLTMVCVTALFLWGCPSSEPGVDDPSDMPTAADTVAEPGDAPGVVAENPDQPLMGQHMDEDEHEAEGPGPVPESPGELSGEVADGVRVVKVTAHKFMFMPDRIVVKAGEPVRLEVTSTDVAHGMDIEGMEIDVELPPNETQNIEFTPEEPGTYHFHCSVYCGEGHEDMHGTLIVVP